jgi:hypothetical protein
VSARIVIERPARLEAMQWQPADLATVGPILAWLEIRVRVPTRLGDDVGSRTVLHITTADRPVRVPPGSWVVYHPVEQYVRVLSDADYHHEYEEV